MLEIIFGILFLIALLSINVNGNQVMDDSFNELNNRTATKTSNQKRKNNFYRKEQSGNSTNRNASINQELKKDIQNTIEELKKVSEIFKDNKKYTSSNKYEHGIKAPIKNNKSMNYTYKMNKQSISIVSVLKEIGISKTDLNFAIAHFGFVLPTKYSINIDDAVYISNHLKELQRALELKRKNDLNNIKDNLPKKIYGRNPKKFDHYKEWIKTPYYHLRNRASYKWVDDSSLESGGYFKMKWVNGSQMKIPSAYSNNSSCCCINEYQYNGDCLESYGYR